jgi:hypothetical protein
MTASGWGILQRTTPSIARMQNRCRQKPEGQQCNLGANPMPPSVKAAHAKGVPMAAFATALR